MVRLRVCSSKDLTPLMILDEGTVDHSCYIKNVLPTALKYGKEVFGVTSGSFNKRVQTHTEIIEEKSDVGITFHHCLVRIVDLQTVHI